MPEFTPFAGEMWFLDGRSFMGHVEGHYRWLDAGTPGARIGGGLTIHRGRGGWRTEARYADPFATFGVPEFRGRKVRLRIPGVGDSAVSLRGGRGQSAYVIDPLDVNIGFEAWAPPIMIATEAELGELLRTPAADALEGAGMPELAAVARAAAVALVGWPARPIRADAVAGA